MTGLPVPGRLSSLIVAFPLVLAAFSVGCTKVEDISDDSEIAKYLGQCFELQRSAVVFEFRDVDHNSPRRTHLLFELEGFADLGKVVAELKSGTRFEIERAYLSRGFEDVYVELLALVPSEPRIGLVNLSDALNPDWSINLVSVLVLGGDRAEKVFPPPLDKELAVPCDLE